MKNKKRIGIDFDKVLVNYPPFIPGFFIEKLYKKKNGKLSYRFPGKLEQKIRALSHLHQLRKPISKNIETLKKLPNNKDIELYLISSRFSFLKKRTNEWFEKNNISKLFKGKFFNYENEQPHLFKNRIIKKNLITDFLDDDLDLLLFLSSHNPKINFYWVASKKIATSLPKNIRQIKSLEEFRTNYLINK